MALLHPPPAAVLFDRDNTLLMIDQARAAALAQRCAQAAPGLTPAQLLAHWQQWPGPWPATAADEPAFWARFWSALDTPDPLRADQLDALCAIGADYAQLFVAYDDTIPCLRALARRGIPLAVVTNFTMPSVDRTLARAGLDPDWFALRLATVELPAPKPDPRAFLAVAARLGVAPHACLVVDDLPENTAGARAAGMPAVLLDRDGRHARSDEPRIISLAQLAASLAPLIG